MKKEIDLTLYLVTASNLNNKLSLEEIVEKAIEGGVTIVQLREKHLSDKEIRDKGFKIREITEKYKVNLIVDDRVDIAQIIGADGVHLGQDDIPVKYARAILGNNKIIGKSTHSIEQVIKANEEDLDYIAFGPIFKTPTKDYTPVGMDNIKEVLRLSKFPCVNIGGINLDNVDSVLEKGSKAIAVVRALNEVDNPKYVAEQFIKKIKAYKN